VRSSRRSHKIGKKPPLQLTIQYHPDAVTEMAEAALFYEDRQTGLGERLLNAIEEALEVINWILGITRPIDYLCLSNYRNEVW
jgi:hypothetical protein